MELFHASSFERLTGLAFFTPKGESSAIPLGNIEMTKLDFGLKTRDYTISVRGDLQLRKRRVQGRTPVYSLQGNQLASPTMPLILLGKRLADVVQPPSDAEMVIFDAEMGRAFRLPQVAVTIASVTVRGRAKVLGYDYYVDDPAIDPQTLLCHSGWIVLPEKAGTIVEGDSVQVSYSVPPLTLEEYSAFATPSRDGELEVQLEDEYGPPARETWIMDVTLFCKAAPEAHPDKFRSHTIEAAIYGKPIVRKRPNPYAYRDIILASGHILDLS